MTTAITQVIRAYELWGRADHLKLLAELVRKGGRYPDLRKARAILEDPLRSERPQTFTEDHGLVYHCQAQCRVIRMDYDFATMTGRLVIAAGSSADPAGTIRLFRGVDTRVRNIHVLRLGADGEALEHDITYVRDGAGEWRKREHEVGGADQ